jgi:hypothetical protein
VQRWSRLVAIIVVLSLTSAPVPAFAARQAASDGVVRQDDSGTGAPAELPSPAVQDWAGLMPRGSIAPDQYDVVAVSQRSSAPGFSWLAHINVVRAAAGLSPVVEEAAWSTGSTLHSRYMVKNNYVGHQEEADNPWYTAEGLAAGLHGNAYANYTLDESEQFGIDAWLTTPFHLINVIDPRLTRTGFGWYRERQQDGYQIGATLDVARGIDPERERPSLPVFFPGHGKTMPYSRYFGVEHPDPLTSCPDRAFQGAPIMVQLPSAPRVTSVTLVKDGLRLDRCVFDETTYENADPDTQALGRAVLAGRHAVAILPREPLTAGIYAVSLVADGVTHAWSFAGPESGGGSTLANRETATVPLSLPVGVAGAQTTLGLPQRPASCAKRQDAGIGVVRQGADRLLTIVAARGTNNVIRQLHFGVPTQPLENAWIELNGYPAPITRQGTVTLPPETTQIAFAVQRVASGRAMRAPFGITDGCGDWLTSVEAPALTP